MIVKGLQVEPFADLHGADLRGADLRGADLNGADWYGADLYGADLRYASLHGADLRYASLHGADLRYANLHGADLHDADLRDADLRRADLSNADLRGADLDSSSWPLWCGSVGATVDARIARQLAAHFCAVKCDDPEYNIAREAILNFAKKSHRAAECGLLTEQDDCPF